MVKRVFALLCLCMLTPPAWPQTPPAEPVQAEAPAATPDNIVVLGQRPGPGLWKVSKDGHVLWVFGLYSPLPKNMEWRSQQVETIIAQSQEYIGQPSATAQIGFFRSLTLLPYAIGVTKNPDGAQLKDVLPADVYARWLPLRKKYLDDKDSLERERPIFVADKLFRAGLSQAGLSAGRDVSEAIEKIVKKSKIKATWPEIKLEVDDPVAMLKDFKKASLDDAACFSKTMARLETDLDAMRVRAHAWAKGKLEAMQKLRYTDQDDACDDAMMNSTLVKGRPGLQSIDARMRDAWLAAAEKSLAANASTFSILKLKDVLAPNGYLAALQAKGYTVESPD